MADETRTLAWQLVIETKGIEENTAKASASLNQLTGSVRAVGVGLAAIAAGSTARSLVDFADTFTRVQNSIRLATDSTEEFTATQQALTASALGSSTSLETTATNYARLRASLENYRVTGRDVITISDTITKAVKLQGGSAEMAEDAVRKMARAFDLGTVSSRELKAMLDTSRPLVKALADAMTDGSIPALQLLAKNSKLTGQDMLKALGDAAAGIDEKFKQRVTPLSEAFTNLKTTLLDVFGDAVAKQIQEIADNIKKFGEALPGIVADFQELGIRVKYGWELTLNDIKSLWEILKAYVVKYIADIGALLVGLIPDWAANLSPQVAAFKEHYTKLAQIKGADAENERKKWDQSNRFIYTNMETAIKAVRQTAAAKKAAGGGILDQVIGGDGGMGELPVEGFSAFRKALDSLQAELDKVRDKSAALTIEIRNGAQAAQEYTIRADARRKVEADILAQAAAGKAYSEDEAKALMARSAAVAEATVILSRYEAANKLVQAAADAGMTTWEKAAQKLSDNAAAMAELQKHTDVSEATMRRFNETQRKLREEADPLAEATKAFDQNMRAAADESARLSIQNEALSRSLFESEASVRAYVNAAEARLVVDKQVRDAAVALKPYSDDQIAVMYAQAEASAAAKTANQDAAAAMRLLADAANFGMSTQEQMALRLRDTNEALATLKLRPEQEKVFRDGMARMAASVDPVKNAFADAVKSMGQSIINFVIDGTQSFREFAASVIKDIGRIIAQMLMMQAIKAAFGGTSWASLFGVAKGAAFDRGNVIPFQHGGVVGGPTTFPLRGGRGLMGEAGPEAVMPLARLPGGDLGVKSQPLNLEVVNQTGVNATARVRQDQDRTQVILEAAELGAAWAQSRFNSSVASGYGASATNIQRTYGLTRRKA